MRAPGSIMSNRQTGRLAALKAAGFAAVSLFASATAQPSHAQYTFTSLVSSSTLSGVTNYDNTRLNDNGDISFMGAPTSNVSSAAGAAYYILPSAGTVKRAVGYGDTAPIGSTYSLLNEQYYSFDNSRNLVFSSNVATGGAFTTSNNSGLFVYSDSTGTVSTVIQKGVSILPTGETSGSIGSYGAANGRIVVQEGTTQNAPTYQIDQYSYDGNTKANLVLKGNSIPGSSFGTFNTFTFTTIDNAGGTSFFSVGVGDPGATQGIYARSADGVVSKVANFSDVAPGASLSSGAFNQFSKVVRNTSNQNAFLARATSTTDGSPTGTALYGLWYYDPVNGLTNVALAGEAAPGGGTFGKSLGSYTLGNINESGTGVFMASGLGGTSTSAVFSFTGTTESRLLGIGDSLFGSTVSSVGIPWINNSGSIAFNYTLSSGVSGVLLANIPTGGAAAPEPGSATLLAIPVLLALAGRARRRSARRRNTSGIMAV